MSADDFDDNPYKASPFPENDSRDEEESLAVDEQGIPILEEVFDPDLDLSEDSALVSGLVTESHGLKLPDKGILLDALKEQLLNRMEQELEEITHQIAIAVTAQLSHGMEQTIREELHRSLGHHLEALLDRTLKQSADD